MKNENIKIETSKWSFVKRNEDGSIDYISPLPVPFNYGFIPGTLSADGEPTDAIVLGKRLKFGTTINSEWRMVVPFVDKGKDDPKHVFSDNPLSLKDKLTIKLFFFAFGVLKKFI